MILLCWVQMEEHTEDLVHVQVELATRQGLHNAARQALQDTFYIHTYMYIQIYTIIIIYTYAEREKQLTTGRANEHLNDAATCYEIIAKL